MMCEKCMLAGKSFTIGDKDRAIELHTQCEYGDSCTCQHSVKVSAIKEKPKE